MTAPAMPLAPVRRLDAVAVVARVVFALCVVAGAAVLWTLYAGAISVFPAAFVLAALLECAVVFIGFVLLRRFRPIHAPSFGASVAALAWGATAASGGAVIANDGLLSAWSKIGTLGFASSWGAALSAPLDEEVLKVAGVGLLALAVPALVSGPVDGMVFGALAGLGFQAAENVIYGVQAVPLGGGVAPGAAVVQSFLGRVLVTGLGSHWTMTAVAGAGVGYALIGRRAPAIGLIVLAMAMHWLFDAPLAAGAAGIAVKVALDFVIALAVYLAVRRGYRAHARRVLPPGEAPALLTRSARRRARAETPRPLRPRLMTYQIGRLAEMDTRQ
ncbi:PrsW family glutamic-type intramembrane protease [Actinomadura atramentaria]|uniref:PrsW family glutamic-type intramembrane protease n=1 Tax=Actinomadura atramentaria TaxID=1990 RepID=UPI0003698DB5|nr:PrsW family glutamic-type intramembrane protease [Actinomadura atramentaria]